MICMADIFIYMFIRVITVDENHITPDQVLKLGCPMKTVGTWNILKLLLKFIFLCSKVILKILMTTVEWTIISAGKQNKSFFINNNININREFRRYKFWFLCYYLVIWISVGFCSFATGLFTTVLYHLPESRSWKRWFRGSHESSKILSWW